MSGYHVPPEQWNQQHSPQFSQSQSQPSPQFSQPSMQPDPVAQPQPQPQYSDGLEVVPPSEPEWVSTTGGFGGTHEDALNHKIPVTGEEQYKKYDDGTDAYGSGGAPPRPWYKRKVILGVIGAVAFIAVGLGVGLGVGLTIGKGGDSDGSGENGESSGGSDSGKGDDDSKPRCDGGLCARLLSATVHEDELYVFGRSEDKQTIAFRKYNGSGWEDWDDLGRTTTELISQPSSHAWSVNGTFPRLDVLVVGDNEHSVYNKWLSEVEDWPEWNVVGINAGSPITTCVVERLNDVPRLDLWGTDSGTRNITHTFWWQKDPNDIPEEGFDGKTYNNGWFYSTGEDWDPQSPLTPSKSKPAVICPLSDGSDEKYHDIIWYDTDEAKLWHSQFSDDDNWSDEEEYSGDWIGDPSLYVFDDRNKWYFFGVQENHEMYHLRWDDGTYSNLQTMGGDIISVPAVVSVSEDVLDVVALSEEGTLLHQHFDGSGWGSGWEDLGIRAHSAPTMMIMDEKVWIVAVNADGELMAWSRDDSAAGRWEYSLSEGQNLGGELSLEYWTQGV